MRTSRSSWSTTRPRDASADVAADFARADPRVRLIRQTENTGSYGARNRALAEARGEFVTVQDADDWSHPERIARHLADLLRAPGALQRLRLGPRLDGPALHRPLAAERQPDGRKLHLRVLPPRSRGALRPLGHRADLGGPRVRRPARPAARAGIPASAPARRPARLRPQRAGLAHPGLGHPCGDDGARHPPRIPRGRDALAFRPRPGPAARDGLAGRAAVLPRAARDPVAPGTGARPRRPLHRRLEPQRRRLPLGVQHDPRRSRRQSRLRGAALPALRSRARPAARCGFPPLRAGERRADRRPPASG